MPRALVAPGDFQVASQGYRYVVNGFDLKIPYAATCIVTLRSLINKRGLVIGRFMRAMAEASNLMHSDRALVYQSAWQISAHHRHESPRRSYNSEIAAIEHTSGNPRCRAASIPRRDRAPSTRALRVIKPADMIDRRYLVELDKSGVFGK